MPPPEFNFSRFLFLHSDGNPVAFYMRPCDERQRLRPLIEHGGGSVSLKVTNETVKLIDDNGAVSTAGYISSKFIDDCIKANKLLNMENYQVLPRPYQLRHNSPGKSSASSTSNFRNYQYSSDSEIISEDDLSPAGHIVKSKAVERKGRMKYTLEEDRLIIEYLISTNRYGEAKGKAVWKQLEKEKVTGHSAQSMYTRYKKMIFPNIGSYHIPRDWKGRLTGKIQDVAVSDDETLQEDTDVEQTSNLALQTPENNSTLDSDDHDEFDKNLIKAAEHAQGVDSQSPGSPNVCSSPRRQLKTRKNVITSDTEQSGSRSSGTMNSLDDTKKHENSNSENNRRQLRARKEKKSPQKVTPQKPLPSTETVQSSVNSDNRVENSSGTINSLDDTQCNENSENNQRQLRVRGKEKVTPKKPLHSTEAVHVSANSDNRVENSSGTVNSLDDTQYDKNSNSEETENNQRQLRMSKQQNSPKKLNSQNLLKTSDNRRGKNSHEKRENSPKKMTICHNKELHLSNEAILSPRKRQLSQDENLITVEKLTSSPKKQRGKNMRKDLCPMTKDVPASPEGRSKESNEQQASSSPGPSRVARNQPTTVHKPRVDYVMDVDDTDSQPASQSKTCAITDSESDNIDPKELKKFCALTKKYCAEFNLTPAQFLHCLWANNGVLDDTIFWIKFGTNRDGFPAWELQDEEDLIANRNMERLQLKYGLKGVSEHALWLEDD